MRGDLSVDQYEFGRVVRRALSAQAGPAQVRRIWADPSQGAATWDLLADLGVFAIVVPERHGGLGGEAIDLALALEEVGRHALPLPVVETVTAAVVLAAGADGPAARWLPSLAAGRCRFSVVDSSGLAPYGASTDATLRLDDPHVEVFSARDVTWSPARSADAGLDLASWGGACSAGADLGASAALVRATAAWASALVLVGLGQHLVETTRDHTLAREQFGRPIAEFQAIRHRLADAAVAVEAARGLAWFAAYAADHRPDELVQAAHLAKSSASVAAAAAGAAALQLHGGIGFTWEHDLHLHLQRARSLAVWFGSASEHRVAAGRALLASLTSEVPLAR